MFASRPPCPALRPWVRLLWAGAPSPAAALQREHVLPTGTMHLALRLDGPPLRVFAGPSDIEGTVVGRAVVGGARDTFYVRETGLAGSSVGVQLEPAAARTLFGASAESLAGRHTLLEDLWPSQAALLIEQLQDAGSASLRMALLERYLLARLRAAPAIHPGAAAALASLRAGSRVADAVRASGLSHRHLVLRLRDATGLAPAQHLRLLRLQQVLKALRQPQVELAQAAADAGYADQAHFTRDFRALTGLTPGAWKEARPTHTHHVPVAPAR